MVHLCKPARVYCYILESGNLAILLFLWHSK